jgi:hypothetical protein
MRAYGDLRELQEYKLWVEKTPGNEWYGKQILRMFPHAKILYIIRDPRAIYPSYRQYFKVKGHQKYLPLVRFCAEWKESLAAYHTCQQMLPVLMVKYEDLVLDTRHVMEGICNFLGIIFHDSLLQPTLVGKPFKGVSGYQLKATNFTGVDTSSLTKWQTVLSDHDRKIIHYLLSSGMDRLGYLDSTVLTPQQAIDFLLRYHFAFMLLRLRLRVPEPIGRQLALVFRRQMMAKWDWVYQYQLYRRYVAHHARLYPSEHEVNSQ